jgi:hypothetical protein
MLNATFRPLTQWPGTRTPSGKRKRAPFRAGYNRTLDDLERELRHVKASSVAIQIDLEPKDIRNDGWPRSSARPKSPGVVLSFVTPTGPLCFPCDTYDTWEDNLRAISLSLAALRAVDRYGVTKHAEQYRGFKAIEAPGAQSGMNYIEAIAFIRNWGGAEGTLEDAYRKAARALHPDAAHGSHEQFTKLQQAREVAGRGSN